jgi:hypothetical protein
MPENNPNPPGGAMPPRPSDSKVLPKKETVRINLPPKPSAAPTIKLPTLPPGGPSAMASSSAPPATSAPRATAAPPTSAPMSAQRPAPGAATRPQARPAAAAISGLDKFLALTAAVAALVAIGTTLYLAGIFGGFDYTLQ